MNDPEPMDDKEAPEIRGGNRPADYIPEVPPKKNSGMFGHHEPSKDVISLVDDDEDWEIDPEDDE